MELLGKATINPVVFVTGKVSGYIAWTVMFIFMAGIDLYKRISFPNNEYFFYSLLVPGLIFIVFSLANLGRSTRLGLPTGKTVLKTGGIYKISRNPMYLGLHFITIASMIYTLGIWTLLPGIYSIVVYHLIIRSEEQFLEERFGEEYKSYMGRTRRYL